MCGHLLVCSMGFLAIGVEKDEKHTDRGRSHDLRVLRFEPKGDRYDPVGSIAGRASDGLVSNDVDGMAGRRLIYFYGRSFRIKSRISSGDDYGMLSNSS